MNNKIRILTLIISIIFCMAGMMLTVYASEGPTTDPGINQPIDTPTDAPPVDTPTDAPTYAPTDAPPVDTPTEGNDPGYDNGDDDGYYYDPESDPDNDGISNTGNSAGSVSENTDLFDTHINEQELKESQWSNITLDTSTNNNSNVQDFSAIKEDTSTNNNGQWMLYVGFALIGLAVIGILYFIIATSKYKKKLKKLKSRELRHRENHRRASSNYGDSVDEYPTQADYNRRYQRNRYSDVPYVQRRQSKFDTADIPTGRYKSRH